MDHLRTTRGRPSWHDAKLHWWARPHVFTLIFLIPLFIICASLPDDVFLTWKHARNFVSGEAFVAALGSLVAFAGAGYIASRVGIRRGLQYGAGTGRLIARAQYRTIMYCVLCIALAAYVLLLGPALLNPGEVTAGMRESLGALPGVTSFVNLGPLYVTLLFLQATLTGSRLSRFDKMAFFVFLLFVVARVFLWSERLALLEILIPIVVIRLAPMTRHRALIATLPLAGTLALALYFGMTEYFRSWTDFYEDTGIPFTEFVTTRLFGYYATAINNGAIVFTTFEPRYVASSTAEWFFKLPWLPLPEDGQIAAATDRGDMVFLNFANPEFNNVSGVFAPLDDFGTLGGIVVWLVLGAFTGRLYRGFATHRLMPMLLFPTWMTGVYEVLRIFYWGGPRYFPVLALVPVVFWLLGHSGIRRRLPAGYKVQRRIEA